jgi:hypothetical protein
MTLPVSAPLSDEMICLAELVAKVTMLRVETADVIAFPRERLAATGTIHRCTAYIPSRFLFRTGKHHRSSNGGHKQISNRYRQRERLHAGFRQAWLSRLFLNEQKVALGNKSEARRPRRMGSPTSFSAMKGGRVLRYSRSARSAASQVNSAHKAASTGVRELLLLRGPAASLRGWAAPDAKEKGRPREMDWTPPGAASAIATPLGSGPARDAVIGEWGISLSVHRQMLNCGASPTGRTK